MVSNTSHTYNVIPAQAGIQQLKKSAKRTRSWFCLALPELLNQLDSRLRGNDEGECGLIDGRTIVLYDALAFRHP